MKVVTVILFSLIIAMGFSQKKYEFDYWIEYEVTHFQDSVKIKNRPFREKDTTFRKILLTNSKKNDYLVVLTEVDSVTYALNLTDNEGISINSEILKSELLSSENFSVACELVSQYTNPFTYQTKNYDFIAMTDTTIAKSSYHRYKLASIKPKKVKRLKLGTEYYIIDKHTGFHKPILEFSTAYEEWKTRRNLTNGILFEKYFIDYYGNLDSKEKLLSYRKINKEIRISSKCGNLKN